MLEPLANYVLCPRNSMSPKLYVPGTLLCPRNSHPELQELAELLSGIPELCIASPELSELPVRVPGTPLSPELVPPGTAQVVGE